MTSLRIKFTLALLALVLCAGLAASTAGRAQIVVVDEKLVCTETRADKAKIGVTVGNNHGTTANWVKIESKTRISYQNRIIAQSEMWRLMKPGRSFRVHGGRDFDNNIVAKKIWL